MMKKRPAMNKSGLLTKRIPISLRDWEQMHPFPNRYYSDSYYCNLANRLAPVISAALESSQYTQQNAKDLALAVTAYFEDAVSELGMWRAFIEKHKQLYKRWLPWYDTSDDYYEDEINLQDVQFVLWINMMRMREGAIVNPENPTLFEMAAEIYYMLEEEFETAPINDELVEEIYSPETTEIFGKLKSLLSWMGSSSYLLKPSIFSDPKKTDMQETLDKGLGMNRRSGLSKYVVDSYWGIAKPTGPLALLPCEWYALMREQKGIVEGNDEIRKIKATPLYPFIIVRNDGKGDLLLRSVRGQQYEVDRDSFELGSDNAIKENNLTVTTLAYYKGRWHINGFSSSMKTDGKEDAERQLEDFADRLTDESGVPIDLMGKPDFDATDEFLPLMDTKLVEAAVKKNGGSRLFYFANMKEAMEWQIKTFDLNGCGELPEDSSLVLGKPLAIFLTKDGKLCIVPSVNLIADPANPYYAKADSESELGIIADQELMPSELVSYLIKKKFLKHLGLKSMQGERHGRKLLQDNISFMATYLRQEPT